MSALVGYASSDEEDDVQPEKPTKIPRVEQETPPPTANISNSTEPPLLPAASNEVTAEHRSPGRPIGPAPGPDPRPASTLAVSTSPTPEPPPQDENGNPLSPSAYERLRLRELTMPSVPNFDIPDSPPPPSDVEERAQLAATTKKFAKFLELKKQGVHFNQRLDSSTSLRNPSLLPKLMDFAGINQSDSYASTLPSDGQLGKLGGVASKWPEEWYVESLLRENESREKKMRRDRDKVDFVPAEKQDQ